MSRIDDPKTFIKNGGEVYRYAKPDKDFELKEDKLFVEKFGKRRWNDENIQYELAETYYRLGDYKSALRKLDEILENDPNSKTKYFEEKHRKYKLRLSESKDKKQ